MTPRGDFVGVIDEYGTIWSGTPGASKVIGDAVLRSDEETMDVYLVPLIKEDPADEGVTA